MGPARLASLLGEFVVDSEAKVLDVGCGISSVLLFLPGHRYGIDPLADRYREIHDFPSEIDIRAGYGESIPYEDERFDLVTCSNCIDHTQSPTEVVREFGRVLKPGGWLILTCEVYGKDLGRRNVGHPHSMTEERLLGLLKDFELVEHWSSPWPGLTRHLQGRPPTQQIEHILLARSRADKH